MKVLAIESSGDCCSVALSIDGSTTQRQADTQGQQHSRLLLPMQAQVLSEAGLAITELDLICCAIGPGSFTGVRVATALTQGLAFAADLPVAGVSTLASMAYGLRYQTHTGHAEQALVLLDARMNEVYWAYYSLTTGLPEPIEDAALSKPDALPALGLNHCVGLGNGWAAYEQALQPWAEQCVEMDVKLRPCAAWVAELAAAQIQVGGLQPQKAEALQPLYVRNQVTHQHKNR